MDQPSKPYIEKRPRRSSSSRPQIQHQNPGDEGHYNNYQTGWATYGSYGGGSSGWQGQAYQAHGNGRDRGEPSRQKLPNSSLPYRSGDPLPTVPYTDSVPQSPPGTGGTAAPGNAPTEEAGSVWTEDKRRLAERFGSRVGMDSLTLWLYDHNLLSQQPNKATELAQRARHNMSTFVNLLASYIAMRERAKACPHPGTYIWSHERESLHQEAQNIQAIYQHTVAGYNSSFERKPYYSPRDVAEAQQLLKDMFYRDYNAWDGLVWHIVAWITHYRKFWPGHWGPEIGSVMG